MQPQSLRRQRPGPLMAAVLAALLVAPPAAASVTPGAQEIRFESTEVIRYALTVRFSDQEAQLLRVRFDVDRDQRVSSAEVQAADRNIARYFPSTAPPYLDGYGPLNTTYDPSNIQGAVGPTNATTPVTIRLHLVHTYQPAQDSTHVLLLRRGYAPQDGVFAEIAIRAPPAFVIAGHEGLGPSMQLSPDGMNLTGIMPLQGPVPNATVTFQLDARWGQSGGIPSPAVPAVLGAILAAGAVLARSRARRR